MIAEESFSDIIDKPHKCKICHNRCKTIAQLDVHLLTHTGEKPHKCIICKRRFSQVGNLKAHLLTHSGEKPYKCHLCDNGFAQAGNLRTHLLTHTGEKPHVCTVCNRSFSQIGNLSMHLLTHTGEKPYTCEICNYSCSQAGNLRTHLVKCSAEKANLCKICQMRFVSVAHLQKHVLTHVVKKPNERKVRIKSFPKICNLKNRSLPNNEEENLYDSSKSYNTSCEQADESKSLIDNVEKLHKCKICNYSFPADILVNHILMHDANDILNTTDPPLELNDNVEKLQKCKICNYSCSQAGNLRTHLVKCLVETANLCNICKMQSFADVADLQMHVLTHIGETPNKSEIGKKSISNMSNLKNHLLLNNEQENLYDCSTSYNTSCEQGDQSKSLIDNVEKLHKCKICNYSFPADILVNHILMHDANDILNTTDPPLELNDNVEKLQKCKICNYSCSQAGNLRTHLVKCLVETANLCNICKMQSFADVADLQMHVLTHIGETPNKSEIGKKSISNMSNLKNHLLLNNEQENLYDCSTSYNTSCEQGDQSKSLIDNVEKLHKCKICNYSFPADILVSHILMHNANDILNTTDPSLELNDSNEFKNTNFLQSIFVGQAEHHKTSIVEANIVKKELHWDEEYVTK